MRTEKRRSQAPGSWRFANFYFFYYCTVGVITPFWSLYLKHLGFNPTEIGQLTGILVITKVLAPLVWAAVIDRANIHKGHSLSILKWATGSALIIYLSLYWPSETVSFAWMAAVLFGYSIFWNACIPQVEAATMNHLGGDRFQYGKVRLWGSIGFIVSVLGLGYVLDHALPIAILHAGGLTFIAVFIASFLLVKGRAIEKTNPEVIPVRQLLNKKVVLVLFLCVLMQASHAPFYTFFSLYLELFDYSKLEIGGLWTFGVVLEIFVFWWAHLLLKQSRLLSLFALTLVATAVRWLLLAAYPQSLLIVLFVQGLHAITYGLNHVVMIQLMDQFFQGRYQVRGQALYVSVSFGIGGAVGSVISGYIWSGAGPSAVFYSAAGLMVIASLLSLLLISRRQVLPIKEL